MSLLALLGLALELVGARWAPPMRGNLAPHWRFNHTWIPGGTWVAAEWVANNPEYPMPYTQTYNNQGWLESYDVTKHRPPGTYRIFYMGDSFTEGTCPMEQSVPSRVERALNHKRKKGGPRYEVINTGTGSYSPMIFYVLLRYKILDYAPDLLVINVDMTDDYDDWKYHQTAIYDDQGNPWAVPLRDVYRSPFIDTDRGAVKATLLSRAALFLHAHSRFYNLIRLKLGHHPDAIAELLQPPPPDRSDLYPRWAWCFEPWSPRTKKNVGRTLDLLRRIARLCRQRGVKLMITAVPHYLHFNRVGNDKGSGWSRRPHHVIAEVAAEEGVPFLNSVEALESLIQGTPRSTYYYRGDVHFNPKGYGIWAAAHLRFLRDKKNRLMP